jgi:formate hydrogenlyase subunit 6/NADH:ubiquinone oxidoreductase subunit I
MKNNEDSQLDNWALPDINFELCTGCGLCEERCPTKAVQLSNFRPQITDRSACSYCGICEEICPVNAIQLSYQIFPPQYS